MPANETKLWQILEYFIAVLTTISTGMMIWALTAIIALQNDVAGIKASRFTAADGLEIWKAINDVKTQIAEIPKEIPPRWFIERIEKLEQGQDAIKSTVMRIDAKMAADAERKP